MGLGDPYHEHPLKQIWKRPHEGSNCFRCEMPVKILDYCCARCNYFVHDICLQLPKTMTHPFHHEHPLMLFEPQLSNLSVITTLNANTLCNDCHNPCHRFAYHCSLCKYFIHLKCFLTFKCLKHKHLLNYTDWGIYHAEDSKTCAACGYNVEGFGFACNNCSFNIHTECMFLPPTVKHHHVHELTLRHNFPEESKQVYCDRCEDRDGKELDRKISYYFCEKCDYIAHVRCVVDLEEENSGIKHFNHDHRLKVHKGITNSKCEACNIATGDHFYYCKDCDYWIHKSCTELPCFVKHPLHQEHNLTLNKLTPSILQCTSCEYTLRLKDAFKFAHPNYDGLLWFTNSDNMFRCNACGELGEGFRMQSYHDINLIVDIHLECFALPGTINHVSHPEHPLFLLSDRTTPCCNVCNNESDTELWVYSCKKCSFSAHLHCAASCLLSNLRSSIKNEPNYCAIIDYDKTSFNWKLVTETLQKSICVILSAEDPKLEPHNIRQPVLFKPQELNDHTDKDVNEQENLDETVELQNREEHALGCPCCRIPMIRPIDESCVNELSTCIESLTLSDKELLDDIYCHVCSILIFPPFYSCAKCNSIFHKYCVELPRKHITENGHTYVLVAPVRGSLSNCAWCKDPITGFAYVCKTCKISLDVRCAGNAPLLHHNLFENTIIIDSYHFSLQRCNACDGSFISGTHLVEAFHRTLGLVFLHVECALLPYTINHHIHKHTLQLRPDLALLDDDEYICDACEKDLNPNLWAYMCSDSCGVRATSHVSCVIASNKKCHFSYEKECLRR